MRRAPARSRLRGRCVQSRDREGADTEVEIMGMKTWVVTIGMVLTIATFGSESWAKGRGRVRYIVALRAPGSVFFSHGHVRGARPYYYAGAFYGPNGYPIEPRNYGRVDFNVHPEKSKVYVNGAYLGIAGDFNGGFFGTTAALPAGPHLIRVVAPDGRTAVQRIYVVPGREVDFKVRFKY
jgi:hypothetical protein